MVTVSADTTQMLAVFSFLQYVWSTHAHHHKAHMILVLIKKEINKTNHYKFK
jgi:hypothetical protein